MPIVGSAVVASLVAARFVDHRLLLIEGAVTLDHGALAHVVAVTLIASAASVALMSAVAACERLFNATVRPAWLRPAVGARWWQLRHPDARGAVVRPTAPADRGGGRPCRRSRSCPSPCSSRALRRFRSARGSRRPFFASLFVGALIGRAYGDASAAVTFVPAANATAMAILGMAGLGTGIVGAPFAMTRLALEMTSDFWRDAERPHRFGRVSLVMRETFGYSFATWRFHLRGETIRGPHDVGWARDLRVARLMRRDVRTLTADTSIAEARALTPLARPKEAMLLDAQGRYCGCVLVSDLHATPQEAAEPVSTLAILQGVF